MHQSTPLWRNWILVCLTLLFGPAANRITAAADSAGVTFVNAAHIGGRQSGTSWATAYSSLQSAISSGTTTIWVARGVYSPGNRHRDTFQLRTVRWFCRHGNPPQPAQLGCEQDDFRG